MKRVDIATSALPGADICSIAGAVRAGERVYLSGANALQPDGRVLGVGDATAQTHAALDRLELSLKAAGGSLANITKLTTCIVDRGYRAQIYSVIAERLKNVYPVSTGLVVAGLGLPELIVQIDAEAAIPTKPVKKTRPYSLDNWHGQGFAWQGSMVIATDDELFVRGQTGASLDHSGATSAGRGLKDAEIQADLALKNLAQLLGESGSSMEDVCKITVYISDRAYRPVVYPMIGKHFGTVRPVSTGIVISALARPEILFEIDVNVLRKKNDKPHKRVRPYSANVAKYGHDTQKMDCEFCMAVRVGDRIILRGQTGIGLDEVMYGDGDARAQAEQAMDNVAVLLREAGASLTDVVKATVYVTDRAFMKGVNEVVLKRLAGAKPAFTSVIVKGLAGPELLMEVDIHAICNGGVS